ncbi:MAG: rRNA pseudouridine synthase [Deltaproteobacteria bacterium]|nr:MAG: rRNA pseudouridine synthase [Deltaproteobacteria bacterium]
MRERLQKIIAAAGVASRRRAEAFVRAGRVTVNGVVARLGDAADPDVDVIALDGVPLEREPHAFWMVHKPRGVLTTAADPQGRRTVLDLLPREARERVFPVGRLDRDSEGLLLLTNDGAAAQALLHPSFGSEREYRVTVRGRPTRAALRALASGVELPDGRTAPARVERVASDPHARTTTFHLTVIEGRKRQIRRSLRALGHPVMRLVRIRMGPLHLGRLRPESARPLTARERRALREHVQRCARASARRSP